MKICITGGKGMLGRTLVRHWAGQHELLIADLPEYDVTNEQTFLKALEAFQPAVVVHCAAMTRVDACETDEVKATLLNVTASACVARATAAVGARLIAISTDYVFSGNEPGERSETDPTQPCTVYGKTKLAGEEAIRKYCPHHIIARIAWLYGAGGPSFLHTMKQLASADPQRTLSVVDDQFGNPTSTDAVADGLTQFLAHPELEGTFHLTCEGTTTWFGFAQAFFKEIGVTTLTVKPCTTDEYPRPAPRPHYSSLSKAKLRAAKLSPMPTWQAALSAFCASEWKA